MTLRLHVILQNHDIDTDTLSHISEWSLGKHHQKQIEQVLRKLYSHPNTKFSIKIKRIPK